MYSSTCFSSGSTCALSANRTSTPRGSSVEVLEATGKRLVDFADTLGLPFEFCAVAEKAGNVDLEKLGVTRRKAVAVHWLHHSLYGVTVSDSNTLWLIQRHQRSTSSTSSASIIGLAVKNWLVDLLPQVVLAVDQ
ncbi:hypothetical protein EJB05_46411, partial [Eragrostis curvula]